MPLRLRSPPWIRSSACLVLAVCVAGCDSPLMNLGEEITLSAAIDEAGKPVEIRERFSLEDDRIYVHLAIPPQAAGSEQRDFLFEILDGNGNILSSRGSAMTRTRADWLVRSSYWINPELDAPGFWSVNVYVDGQHLESRHFPVTETPESPQPDAAGLTATAGNCCETLGTTTLQVFLGTGIDEEKMTLTGRREGFRFSDGKMHVFLRLRHIPDGPHKLLYHFYDGAGKPVGMFEYAFTSANRNWNAWASRELARGNAPGLWTVDIHLDGHLLGSVRVPVEE